MSLSLKQTYLLAALSAHVAWAIVAVFSCLVFGFQPWIGAVGILGVAAVKETVVDPRLEGNPFWNGTFDSGAGDLSGYLLGVGLSYLLFVLFIRPL
jgi:hypothetical protein